MTPSLSSLLRPEHLQSVAGLELVARMTVDTILAGLHRSLRLGAGTAFSQYRSYQPGDDLRRLDWKLFARSDRFFVREAEVETNVTVRFLLDASNSMRHENRQGLTKLDYGRYLIATLAWLAHTQGDTLAFVALNDLATYQLSPRSGRQNFRRFLHELLGVHPSGKFPAGRPVEAFLPGSRRQELLIFLSDLHEHDGELSSTLQRLGRSRHEVLLFHLLARNELDLDYTGVHTFEDLESRRRIRVAPERIRRSYKTTVQQHLHAIGQNMLLWHVNYHRFVTDEPAGEALNKFLVSRRRLG